MQHLQRWRPASIFGLLLAANVATALTLNLVDDFENGTAEGWSGNQLGTITNVAAPS